ncbi:MAG TPA: S9 family peptidase [Gemmatimonadales bacterium]|nr:S9 family peptidase [Gemmatimonadales bacterium]
MRSIRITAVLAVCFCPGVAAQETASDTLLTVNHYLDWEQVADPQVSPSGAQIVYTRRWVNKIEDRWDSGLWIMNADGSKNRFLVKGSNARWSPDGTRIAYLADGEPKGTQVFVRWMDAEGATSQITHVAETPAAVSWSPDGRSLAFTMLVKSETPWKISMPAPPEGAKWTPAPRIIDRLHYRRDRTGFVEQGTTRIFLVPADGGTPRQLTTGDYGTSELAGGPNFDWTPDGRTIVFDGLRDADFDYRYRESYLYAVDVQTGATRQLVTKKGNWSNPVVSPDGKSVAFTGRDYGTYSYHANEVWTVALDGSGLRALTSYDRDPGDVHWSPDGSGVYFALAEQGTSNVYFAGLKGGNRRITEGDQMLSLSSVSRDLTGVGVRSDASNPADVARFSLRSGGGRAPVTPLTSVNADVLQGMKLGAEETIWYTSTGGTKVEGWIIKPPGFDRTKKYPLILEIHGGPHGMYNGAFSYQLQNFAANGYVVLITNPRGSTGYGSPFGNAIERAYPSVDYDDLMAGVDTVVGRGYIDPQRMYVGGCSGGGVLSSWVIGHTTRFAAAAVRCPVIDWMSMAGQTDVPLFTYGFFDAPFWEKPEQWIKQSSLAYVGNVKTPTLLMTGELDLRTPIPQTEEYYSALKMLKVPVVMLRFNGEYHGTSSKPSNFLRTQLYMMSWFQQHKLGTEGAASTTSEARQP